MEKKIISCIRYNMDFERATPVKRNSLNSWMTSPRTYKKANKQISSYWTLLRLLTKSTIAYSYTNSSIMVS
jgi:hypothetical protein